MSAQRTKETVQGLERLQKGWRALLEADPSEAFAKALQRAIEAADEVKEALDRR